jgi:sulfatase maturation enzyme AslB (radical SAM superfamily)
MKVLKKAEAVKQLSMLIARSQYDFFSEGKFWHVKQIPLKKKLNLIKAGVDNFFPRSVVLSQPSAVQIEPTDVCNLLCTGCWTNNESHQGRSRYLSVEGFKKVLDELGDNLFIIWLWCWGEPFVNKDIYEMIRLMRMVTLPPVSLILKEYA